MRRKRIVLCVQIRPGHNRFIDKVEYLRQLGRSKGGTMVQALGRGHKWTKQSASLAAKKRWELRQRRSKRLGIRLGLKTPSKAIDHEALRQRHTGVVVNGIEYDPQHGWLDDVVDVVGVNTISERTALRRLGYLKQPAKRGFVPNDPGMKVVGREKP